MSGFGLGVQPVKSLPRHNHDPLFPTLNRYWTDPVYRKQKDAENAHARDLANQHIDAGMAALNAKQAKKWSEQ